MIRIAGIIRKSPTNKNVRESIQMQKDAIKEKVRRDLDYGECKIDWFIDEHVSGDTANRPQLNKLFRKIDSYDYAYCMRVDRFSRSFLGLEWFHTHFTNRNINEPHDGCRLRFCEMIPELYKKDGSIELSSYSLFWDMCKMAMLDLLFTRIKTSQGRERLRKNPGLWKKKYPGGKKGRSWKK